MPRTRKPATAEEVQDFFETQPVETAELMLRLIAASLRRRMPPPAPKRVRKPKSAAPTTVITA
jgi:hypothetical protein